MLVNLVIMGRNSLVLEIGLLVKLVIVNGLCNEIQFVFGMIFGFLLAR